MPFLHRTPRYISVIYYLTSTFLNSSLSSSSMTMHVYLFAAGNDFECRMWIWPQYFTLIGLEYIYCNWYPNIAPPIFSKRKKNYITESINDSKFPLLVYFKRHFTLPRHWSCVMKCEGDSEYFCGNTQQQSVKGHSNMVMSTHLPTLWSLILSYPTLMSHGNCDLNPFFPLFFFFVH